jgi:Exopolysaccharide biosynthesis protein
MKKCIIWGAGNDYDRLYNNIQFEVYKENIEIKAIVSRKENIFCNYMDKIPLITKEEIRNYEFDYIIVCSGHFFNEISNEACSIGIERNKVLNGCVFTYAHFDFNKYIQLIENPITIISDDCWGGQVYHALFLQFNSPTININWKKEEYAKFVSDLSYYLRQPLRCGREGNLDTGEYPIGLLGENEKEVQMELIHNISFQEVRQQWERRVKRVNFNNIFVKFGLNKRDNWEYYLNIFDLLPYKKICFFSYVRDKEASCIIQV